MPSAWRVEKSQLRQNPDDNEEQRHQSQAQAQLQQKIDLALIL